MKDTHKPVPPILRKSITPFQRPSTRSLVELINLIVIITVCTSSE